MQQNEPFDDKFICTFVTLISSVFWGPMWFSVILIWCSGSATGQTSWISGRYHLGGHSLYSTCSSIQLQRHTRILMCKYHNNIFLWNSQILPPYKSNSFEEKQEEKQQQKSLKRTEEWMRLNQYMSWVH